MLRWVISGPRSLGYSPGELTTRSKTAGIRPSSGSGDPLLLATLTLKPFHPLLPPSPPQQHLGAFKVCPVYRGSVSRCLILHAYILAQPCVQGRGLPRRRKSGPEADEAGGSDEPGGSDDGEGSKGSEEGEGGRSVSVNRASGTRLSSRRPRPSLRHC